MSGDRLSEAIDAFKTATLRTASASVDFCIPFFPNTFMLAYALAKMDQTPQYIDWNKFRFDSVPPSSSKRTHGPANQLLVGIATDKMIADIKDNSDVSILSQEHITTFRPAYIYISRHFHYPDNLEGAPLNRASLGFLVDGFRRVVLFGDTNEQTKALARVFQDWVGTQPRIEPICAEQWLPANHRDRGLVLEMFYMSPSRRISLDHSRNNYVRMALDDATLKELLSDFRTSVVVWQAASVECSEQQRDEAIALVHATKSYLSTVFQIANCARGPASSYGELESSRTTEETIEACRALNEPWEIYTDMARAVFPTAAPRSPSDFAALLADHHVEPRP